MELGAKLPDECREQLRKNCEQLHQMSCEQVHKECEQTPTWTNLGCDHNKTTNDD